MARLAAQSAENAALKERQAKLDKDQRVSVLHPGFAITGTTFSSGSYLLGFGPEGGCVCSTQVVPELAEPVVVVLYCFKVLIGRPVPECFAWLCPQGENLHQCAWFGGAFTGKTCACATTISATFLGLHFAA